MNKFELYEHVKIISNGATGTIVDIKNDKDKYKYYCIEYDEEFSYLDKDMGIIYVKEDDIEKLEDAK